MDDFFSVMNWREVVARWLAGKGVILGGELKIMELVELMSGKRRK